VLDKEIEIENKFNTGYIVIHNKTMNRYVIVDVPHKSKRLEESNEPFYSYHRIGINNNHIIWFRSKSKMEDGRFSLV
jgi:hypothetical protein